MSTAHRTSAALGTSPANTTPSPEGRRIVLGVGGGIAAYKSCELLRRLRAAGHDVAVVPTPSALEFIGAATFEALSGHPVATGVFSDVPDVRHVTTGQQADLMIVAPATADLLARAAAGMADDLLTATLLVTRAPVLMAPAMHTEMWTHPATEANVRTLRSRGVIVIPPADGRLTGTDSGPGRLPEAEHLAQLAELLLHGSDALRRDLAGRRVVVSAGGTREAIDPVRFLGNRSSGRQGFAIAMVAAARGAEVTLIAANTALTPPPAVQLVPVTSARELQAAVQSAEVDADAVVMNAAVADFRPTEVAEHKLKKHGVIGDGAGGSSGSDGSGGPGADGGSGADRGSGADGGPVATVPALQLTENPDILAGLVSARGAARRPVMVGFAAETGDGTTSPLEFARQKLARKGCDLLVMNRVDRGLAFGADDNAAVILNATGPDTEVPLGPKTVVAAAVCDALAEALNSMDTPSVDTVGAAAPDDSTHNRGVSL